VTAANPELEVYLDGAAWTDGPQAVYDRLAAAALAVLPERLEGVRALDVGAGTGAATRELLRRGSNVVAVDTAPAMLAELTRQTGGRVLTLVADIRRLGLPDDEYDVSVAAFVLNHLDEPAAAVRELARVTRPGGRVIATTFGPDDHPMKPAVDEVLKRHGWSHPPWYANLKTERVPLTATVAAFEAVGAAGGLTQQSVAEISVDLSDLPAEARIGYRLGMPHIAPFMASLEASARVSVEADVAATLEQLPPLRLRMLVLTGLS
jgi:SAM-dependent methyltransferase